MLDEVLLMRIYAISKQKVAEEERKLFAARLGELLSEMVEILGKLEALHQREQGEIAPASYTDPKSGKKHAPSCLRQS